MTCLICDMKWQRTLLVLKCKKTSGVDVLLRNGKCLVAPTREYFDDGSTAVSVVFNMSNTQSRSFLNNGLWEIVYRKSRSESTEDMRLSEVSEDLCLRLEEFDRVFRYGGKEFAYTVSFVCLGNQEGSLALGIESYFMKVNKNWRKVLSPAFQKRGFRLKRFLANSVYYIIRRLTPRIEKRVLFLTETSNTLKGNLSALYHRMIERGFEKDYKIRKHCGEVFKNHNRFVAWFRLLKEVAKSDIIVLDNYAPTLTYLKLDSDVRLVQIWHAGLGFKSLGYSRFGREGSPHPVHSVHRKYDLALAPSQDLIDVYAELFGIEEDSFVIAGLPRLDQYASMDYIETRKKSFFKEHPELIGKRIILFAPTYRGRNSSEAYYDYEMLEFDKLYKFCGNTWAIIVKMHPFVKKTDCVSGYEERIHDFSTYDDVNSLLEVADLLITDYSSIYYDYSFFKKPILFFTYDRLKYEATQGVHHSVKENAPGKVCDSFGELMQALENKDYEIEKTVEFSSKHFPEGVKVSSDYLIDCILHGDSGESNLNSCE